MAILSKEEYFKKLHERIGTASDDESISFVEDMSDTYNEMERRASDKSGENWKQKYDELDASWRARYMHRFQTGFDNMNPNSNSSDCGEDDKKPEDVKIDDLFVKKGDN